jgi:hypothetical protein
MFDTRPWRGGPAVVGGDGIEAPTSTELAEYDLCSHNMGLDDAGASILHSPVMAELFLAGRGGRLLFAAALLARRCFD